MFLQADVTGLSALVTGPPGSTDAGERRYASAGARVTVASSPELAGRASGPFQLTVVVGAGPEWDAAASRLRGGTLVVREDAQPPGGRAVLVGAGPEARGC